MLILGPNDPLASRPRRVTVAGTSGAGKTTLGRQVAEALGLPFTEMDGLYHGPGWVPRESFVDDVTAVVEQEEWVAEWQYSAVRPLVLERAELLVWLDLPVATVMRQLVTRSVRRSVRREKLWNGNVEPPLWAMILRRGDENIVDWGWRTRHSLVALDERLAVEAPHLVVVRLRTRSEVSTWVQRLRERTLPEQP